MSVVVLRFGPLTWTIGSVVNRFNFEKLSMLNHRSLWDTLLRESLTKKVVSRPASKVSRRMF